MNFYKYFLTIIFVGICCCIQQSEQQRNRRPIVVEIQDLGKVRGRVLQSKWTNQQIYQFYDIKYGETTSGERRFKASIPAKPWDDVRDAMNPRRGCPALQDLSSIRRNEKDRDVEDCLFLTISTKNLEGQLPVMVYLHGEFLYEGTSLEASPEYLLEKDIVLVSVRYRLAPFGFLSTMSDEIPGNAAITDVILALEWIQKYIQNFGGNPASVTLFGQVGGAGIANLLTMSPKVNENLFHRLIYQSGSALTPFFVTDNPLKFTQDIAKKAGCNDIDNIELINGCLRNMTPSKLLEGFSKHGLENSRKGIGNYGGLHFVIGGPSGILPEHPAKLIRDDKIRYYPTIGGVTKNAGTFILKEIFQDDFDEKVPDSKYNASTYIEYIITHTNGGDPSGAWTKFAESDFFTEDEMKNGTFQTMIPGFIDMCGTIPFKNPILLALQANAKQMPNDTYLYSFDYEGEYNRYLSDDEFDQSSNGLPFDMGVSLTDENLYLFPWPSYASYLNRRDTRMARRLVSFWTSFATTGVPKASGIKYWPPMTDTTGPYLKIDYNSTIGESFVDEYSITVKEARKGNSLVIEEFFNKRPDEEEEEEEDYDDYDYDGFRK